MTLPLVLFPLQVIKKIFFFTHLRNLTLLAQLFHLAKLNLMALVAPIEIEHAGGHLTPAGTAFDVQSIKGSRLTNRKREAKFAD